MFRFFRAIFFCLSVVLFFIIGSIIAWTMSFFYKDKSQTFRIVAKYWAKALLFVGGIKISISGLENIPKNQAAIFVSNHQSAVDIPILTVALPFLRFAPKIELAKIPFFGWYIRRADYLIINRASTKSMHKTIEKAKQIINQGHYLHMFPEGTRSYDGTLGEFKRGSLFIAFQTGAPIVPIAISGSFKIMPRGKLLINPTSVKIIIGKPVIISSRENYDKALGLLKSTISELLEQHP